MSARLAAADIDFGAGSQPLVLIRDSLHCDGHFAVLACVQRLLKAADQKVQTLLMDEMQLKLNIARLQVVLAHARWPESHYQAVLKRLVSSAASAAAGSITSSE